MVKFITIIVLIVVFGAVNYSMNKEARQSLREESS